MYVGTTAPIPLGQLGLQVDDPMSVIPPNAAIKANNISLTGSRLEKARGSAKFSITSLGSGVVGVYDWWPDPNTQFLIAVTRAGRVWLSNSPGSWFGGTYINSYSDAAATVLYPTGLGTLDPSVQFVSGGNEITGNSKKLFIFTNGSAQIQVIPGNGSFTRAIQLPATDWASSNFPTFGVIYQSRLIVLRGHRVYISTLLSHEDFQTSGTGGVAGDVLSKFQQYAVFSGEGDALIGGIVYKGMLLLFKRPAGVYVFNWQDTTNYPSITRYTDSFGIASPHAASIVLDDLIIGSNTGSLTSLKATNAYGSFEQGDVLQSTRTRDYIRSEFDPTGIPFMHSMYYPEKEIAYFTGRNSVVSPQNRMIVMDVSRQSARLTLETKDQPNCLGLRKDSNNILRPMYGSDDGYIYLMDQVTRDVGGLPYIGEYQTPYIDFSYLDQTLSEKTKIFDFLTITYRAAGVWSFYVDVYVDGSFVEKVTYAQKQGSSLGSFILNVSRLGGIQSVQQRNPLHCSGRTISLRVYNSNVDEYFRVEQCAIGFRIGGDTSNSSKD